MCESNPNFYSNRIIGGRSQTMFIKQGRYVVQKYPLFVNIYTIENVNAGGVGGQKKAEISST